MSNTEAERIVNTNNEAIGDSRKRDDCERSLYEQRSFNQHLRSCHLKNGTLAIRKI